MFRFNRVVLAIPGFLSLDKFNDFIITKKLGEGGAGLLYKGELHNDEAITRAGGTVCAIKEIKGTAITNKASSQHCCHSNFRCNVSLS